MAEDIVERLRGKFDYLRGSDVDDVIDTHVKIMLEAADEIERQNAYIVELQTANELAWDGALQLLAVQRASEKVIAAWLDKYPDNPGVKEFRDLLESIRERAEMVER